MSCFVPIITQKLARLQQQQQITQTPAPAKGLLCSKAAIFLFRSAPKIKYVPHRKQQPYYACSNELFNTQAPLKKFSCNKLTGEGWMDFGWEVCSLLLHRELPPSARHRKFETDWGKKKKGGIKNLLGQTH